jgi:hypothetical protein
MHRIMLAAVLTALSSGTPSMSHAQLGSAIKKKAAEAVKDASKKDTAKVTASDSARKAGASVPLATPAASPAQSGTAKSDPKVWENYDERHPEALLHEVHGEGAADAEDHLVECNSLTARRKSGRIRPLFF